MRGIKFVVDDVGKKKAMLIGLEEWGELWGDFYDVLTSESRKDEPTVPWSDLKEEMKQGEQKVG
jgi:hypothetical protein